MLRDLLLQIEPLDSSAMEQAQKRWNSIAKPLHSLGVLEDLVMQFAGIFQTKNVDISKKAVVAMCADNGVVEEGVTQSGQEITAVVCEEFRIGASTVCKMCDMAHADLVPIDIGVAVDTKIRSDLKVMRGTKNFLKEPAMSREQAVQAIEAGIKIVSELKTKGYHLIGTGEMGIGNTTTSSAMAACFLRKSVPEMTGRGAGLTSAGLERKIQVIEEALAMHRPDPDDAIDVLSKVGGLDIAGLAGVFLGGAIYRIPVAIDGFISAVAALTAVKICPACKDYIIATHVSKEPAAKWVLDAIEKKAVLHAEMCLGEGTGAVATFPVLDMGCMVYNTMSTFDDYQIETYEELK